MFGFWCFMLMCVMLIPLTMIIFGSRFLKKPPAKINGLYGYRTTKSMKNQETWDFAHRYCGKLWRIMGWIMLPLSALVMISSIGQNVDFTGIFGGTVMVVQCIIMFVTTLILTERALSKNFDRNGQPKSCGI